jgi:hypothetical protein
VKFTLGMKACDSHQHHLFNRSLKSSVDLSLGSIPFRRQGAAIDVAPTTPIIVSMVELFALGNGEIKTKYDQGMTLAQPASR